jgi:hypothetical protein
LSDKVARRNKELEVFPDSLRSEKTLATGLRKYTEAIVDRNPIDLTKPGIAPAAAGAFTSGIATLMLPIPGPFIRVKLLGHAVLAAAE